MEKEIGKQKQEIYDVLNRQAQELAAAMQRLEPTPPALTQPELLQKINEGLTTGRRQNMDDNSQTRRVITDCTEIVCRDFTEQLNRVYWAVLLVACVGIGGIIVEAWLTLR